jgi:hypothetical protein
VAAALRATQPLVPILHRRRGAVSLGHFGRIGLDLVAAIPAPHDEPHLRRGGAAERIRNVRVALGGLDVPATVGEPRCDDLLVEASADS